MADEIWILVNVVVVGAAVLQSATGIGFGMLAGPVFLMTMDKGVAIQLSIILNLVIAVVLAPKLRSSIDRPLLGHLLIGGIAGLPLGVAVFIWLDLTYLKGFAGLAVFVMALTVAGVFSMKAISTGQNPARGMDSLTGIVSGLMSTSLGMPGPVVAAWMSHTGKSKEAIRATVLALFVVSYGAALLVQSVMIGVASETFWVALGLLPATLGGIFIGNVIVKHIDEQYFKRVVIAALVATAISLFLSIMGVL